MKKCKLIKIIYAMVFCFFIINNFSITYCTEKIDLTKEVIEPKIEATGPRREEKLNNLLKYKKDIKEEEIDYFNENIKKVKQNIEKTTDAPTETISFGKYNINSQEKSSIEWFVLKKDNSDALLISKDIIEEKKYSDKNEGDIYEWLNTEFFENAFTEEEKKIIVNCYNRINNKININKINRKVFLLSDEEAKKFFDNENIKISTVKDNKEYWLRKEKDNSSIYGYIKQPFVKGIFDKNNIKYDDENKIKGIRPCIIIHYKPYIKNEEIQIVDYKQQDFVENVSDIIKDKKTINIRIKTPIYVIENEKKETQKINNILEKNIKIIKDAAISYINSKNSAKNISQILIQYGDIVNRQGVYSIPFLINGKEFYTLYIDLTIDAEKENCVIDEEKEY